MIEAEQESRSNAAEFTVSEISGALKRTVEDAFGHVRVRGEISGYRGPHSSGHAYFALKDERARLEAVVWKGTMSKLRFRPEEGMEVVATGKLTTYPGTSKYQIVIDNLEPAGAGALMALLEERKRRLSAEGLFDPSRKQLLPFMPRVIGVVTSPTGAVIRDIVHRIKDRFPLHIVVWPVRVQGETSAAEVASAVSGFNALAPGGPIPRPDLLIVARGGGSLEDLWGFNEEVVVRAVAASDIPVISAVGHETDTTLCDFAADVRAPTPTGAAEMAVPVRAELEARLATLGARLRGAVSRLSERKRTALRAAARALPSPDQLLGLHRRRFDEATSRLGRALTVGIERKRARLAAIRLTPAALGRQIAQERRVLATLATRAESATRQRLRETRGRLDRARSGLRPESLARAQRGGAERTAMLSRRIDQVLGTRLQALRARLAQDERLLATLSHQAVLARGFALVEGADGRLIRQAAAVQAGEALTLRFADGAAGAIAGGKAQGRARGESGGKERPQGGQGSLF